LTWGRFNVSITFVSFEVMLVSIKRGLVNRSVVEATAEALKATSPWGQLHKYSLTHVLGSAFPGLNYRQAEAPGSWFTVNIAPGVPGLART
jgi:penicillin amidase